MTDLTVKQVQGDGRVSQGDGFVRVTGERVQGDGRMSQGDKVENNYQDTINK